jgi:hypothetical protein
MPGGWLYDSDSQLSSTTPTALLLSLSLLHCTLASVDIIRHRLFLPFASSRFNALSRPEPAALFSAFAPKADSSASPPLALSRHLVSRRPSTTSPRDVTQLRLHLLLPCPNRWLHPFLTPLHFPLLQQHEVSSSRADRPERSQWNPERGRAVSAV